MAEVDQWWRLRDWIWYTATVASLLLIYKNSNKITNCGINRMSSQFWRTHFTQVTASTSWKVTLPENKSHASFVEEIIFTLEGTTRKCGDASSHVLMFSFRIIEHIYNFTCKTYKYFLYECRTSWYRSYGPWRIHANQMALYKNHFKWFLSMAINETSWQWDFRLSIHSQTQKPLYFIFHNSNKLEQII